MTVQQLEYFLSAAKTLNYTKTAEIFFISQSAVTQQIKNLENELNVKLFIRNNNQLTLSAAGSLFVSEAESIVAKINDAIKKVRAVHNGMTGTLSIGYLQCMEMTRFPKTVQNFHNKYPGVHLDLQRGDAIALHDDFLRGRYDIIFNIQHELLTYNDVIEQELGKYKFYAIMPPGHPLNQKKLITQEDLRYEKLIIHDFNRGIPGSPELIPRKYLQGNNLSNVIKTQEDVETILIMVASGIGIGILPNFDIRKPQINLNLIYIPLDTNGFYEVLEIVYAKNNENPLLSLFIQEI